MPSDSSAATAAPERWVDLKTVAQHIGFSYSACRKLVQRGEIPGKPVKSGRRVYWRFRLSDVDAFMSQADFPAAGDDSKA